MAIDNKKEQEREELLHRAIWAIADELHGAVDGSKVPPFWRDFRV